MKMKMKAFLFSLSFPRFVSGGSEGRCDVRKSLTATNRTQQNSTSPGTNVHRKSCTASKTMLDSPNGSYGNHVRCPWLGLSVSRTEELLACKQNKTTKTLSRLGGSWGISAECLQQSLLLFQYRTKGIESNQPIL